MRALNAAAAAIVLCTALLGGCQPDEPAGEPATLATPSVAPAADPTPTAPPSPSAEPTPAATPSSPSPTPDPFAVPATIDAAYTERVLNELFRIDAGTLRLALSAGEVTSEVRERIEAVNAAEEAEIQSTGLNAVLATGSSNVRRPPGAWTISVERVISASPECVTVVGTPDYSAVQVEPDNRRGLYSLVPDDSGAPLNPTSWKILQNRVVDEQGELDLCA